MPSFVYATLAEDKERPAPPSAAADIVAAVEGRPVWDNLQVSPEGTAQFPFMNISWHKGHGFDIQCFEKPESDSDFLATERVLSAPEVYVELGGQTQELWPKQLFVPSNLAVMAVRYFLDTGRQDPSLVWVPIARFPRRTVPRCERWSGTAPIRW